MRPTVLTDPDCEFCRIVSCKEDAREVLRADTVIAFFPLKPAILGHTLLVPRVHVQDIWHLDCELAEELARWTLDLAEAVRRALKPDGLSVIQSNGAAATQTVMHLHIHIVPRWEGDNIGRIWPPATHWSEDQKNSAWEALRQEFRSVAKRPEEREGTDHR
jgi:histidine triad (HIT) family protein